MCQVMFDDRAPKPDLEIRLVDDQSVDDVLATLQRAIGCHYDLRRVEVARMDDSGRPVTHADGTVASVGTLLLVYERGKTMPRLSLSVR